MSRSLVLGEEVGVEGRHALDDLGEGEAKAEGAGEAEAEAEGEEEGGGEGEGELRRWRAG